MVVSTVERDAAYEARVAKVREFLDTLTADHGAGVFEIRAIQYSSQRYRRPHTECGFFDRAHINHAAEAIVRLDMENEGKNSGIYVTLNPLQQELLCRINNRIDVSESAASDSNVVKRKWLLLDCDPKRPVSGISASDDEKEAARDVHTTVTDALRERGWPEPITADSGNGFHAYYRINKPADDGNCVKLCLKALQHRYGTDRVDIDKKVFNPSRICKVAGTTARKGDSTPERPHRVAEILFIPQTIEVVPDELIDELAEEGRKLEEEEKRAKQPAVARRTSPTTCTLPRDRIIDRAGKYVAKMDPAIEGQGGDDHTFHVACVLILGFNLTVDEAWPIIADWNRRCEPPWDEPRLRRKLHQADEKTDVRGYLLDAPGKNGNGHHENGHDVAPLFIPPEVSAFEAGTPTERVEPEPADSGNLLATATTYVKAGISVLPIAQNLDPAGWLLPRDPTDVTKGTWEPLRTRRATDGELESWFQQPKAGIGRIHGAVSGNMESLAFRGEPELVNEFERNVAEEEPGLVQKLPKFRPHRGDIHFCYRCESPVEPGRVLAEALTPQARQAGVTRATAIRNDWHPIIRTYGEGDYTPGIGQHISGPAPHELPTITPEQRNLLLRMAATFCSRRTDLNPDDDPRSEPPLTQPDDERRPVERFKFGQLRQQYRRLNAPVIDGIIRERETANIISVSKIGKSWLAYYICCCIVMGWRLFDRYQAAKGRVLLIDNELHRETLASRITTVTNALGLPLDALDDDLEVWPLRGNMHDLFQLKPELLKIKPGEFKLILIDAKYRAIPPETSENDNAAETRFYNTIDQLAEKTGCAFLMVHHSSKGGQGDKRVTDVGAGAGAQSRAADAHMIIREHEEDNAVVFEAAVRSFKPVEPIGLRWNFPLWSADESLDTEALKGKQQGKKETQAEQDATTDEEILNASATWMSRTDLEKATGFGESRINRGILRLRKAKLLDMEKQNRRGNPTEVFRKSINAR